MNIRNYIPLLIVCFVTQLHLQAQGIQDSTFQISTINVSGERLFKKEDAGMKTSHVDTLVMRSQSSVSLSTLLSENTPIQIKSQGRGALATASMRGAAASHTQVNWNGMNINSPMLGMVDFSQIPVYLIDDINVKYGSASIAEQSGGLGGSININNSVDWSEGLRGKYLQGFGSFFSHDEFLALSFGNSQWQTKTRVYHKYSQNDYTFTNKSIPEVDYQTGDITFPLDTNHNADYRLYGLLQEWYYRPSNQSVFSIKYWGQHSERTLPQVSSYEGAENANSNQQTSKEHKLVADWKYYTTKGKLLLRSGYSLKDMVYAQQYYINGHGYNYTIHAFSQQHSSFNSAQYCYDFSAKSSIKAALDGNFHHVSTEDTVNHTGYDKQQTEISAFVTYQHTFFQRLNTNLMLRQNRINNRFSPLTPYLGFDVKLSNKAELLAKGNIAKNYHSPTLNDLYWQPGGNPDLQAEDGLSSELGLEWRKQGKHIFFSSEITAYYSDINNWILWVPSIKGYWEPRNISQVISKGIEINGKIHSTFHQLNYTLIGNYSYTDAKNYDKNALWSDSYGKQLVYMPKHSANLLFRLDYKKYYATWQHNSYSQLFTTTSNDADNLTVFPPYFMNNITLGYHWRVSKYDINTEFHINNLFNENYRSSLYQPMPGRNYMFLVTFIF